MEQAIGSLLTSKGCKDLIEHIIQCMYNLYGPSQVPVTVVGYVITDFTDLRIYALPPPPAGCLVDAHLRIKTEPVILIHHPSA